jgi:protein gp37
MAKTNIEWCDEVSNWFTGCRNGCSWCYARRMANRLAHIHGTVYERVFWATSGVDPETRIADGDGNPFTPAVHLDARAREYSRLLHSRRPRRVFLGSMGDIVAGGGSIMTFGVDGNTMPKGQWWTPDMLQEQAAFFCRYLRDKGHRFMILTKRPDGIADDGRWPGNAYLGVSVTGNADVSRVDDLVHRDNRTYDGSDLKFWASVEPLLDPDFDPCRLAGLDWVAVGLQTGPGAPARWTDERKRLEDALVRVVRWCQKSGVRVFVKGKIGTDAQDALLPREHLD